MNLKIIFAIILICTINIYHANSQEVLSFFDNIDEAVEIEEPIALETPPLIVRTVFMPHLSYGLISFDDVRFHNISSGITVTRFNLPERDRLLSVTLFYRPNIIINDILPDHPSLFHNAGATITYRANRHTVNTAFIARSDQPIYGGEDTFVGLASYSNNIINWEHFSMDIGAALVVVNLGAELNNGVPWLLWPFPLVSVGWEYEWFTLNLSLLPRIARLTIRPPRTPISLTASARFPEYDIALWYSFFRDKNPSMEFLGIGIGIKNDTNMVSFANNGRRFGINYNALYGSVRMFRLFELSSGWVFNGRAGYGNRNLRASDYNTDIGRGFFISTSARIVF